MLVDQDPPLEAAALGHLQVHGADVFLAVVRAFLSQGAKAPERQASGLEQQREQHSKPENLLILHLMNQICSKVVG